MKVLVDMDDVLEQLAAGWVQYLNDRYGSHTALDDLNDWDIARAFPALTHEQVYAALNDDALWDHVTPVPGAVEGLQTLIAEGHEVYIVTAATYQTLPAKMEKVLFRYFPFLRWEQVVITQNKRLIRGDVLIDDGPHNLAGGDYRKILFTAHHNRGFDESAIGAVRVDNWREALDAVRRIAERYS